MKKKACLICLDGWGVSLKEDPTGDAIRAASTPVMDRLREEYLYTTLEAHGLAVGLPEGLMGNSEVGHLNIGAGRVVYQDIVRIDLALKHKRFRENEAIVKCFNHAKETNGRIHFLGLVSDGGVHSHIDHLIHLLETAKNHGIPKSYIHFFGDGRDTNPRSADKYLEQLQKAIYELNYGQVATIIGRYYAMDRDKRWERIKIAVEALTKGVGDMSEDPLNTIRDRYSKDETDEFLKPIIVCEDGTIRDGDTLFFFNFRSDRMRQIVQTLGISPPPFDVEVPKNLNITCMTKYKAEFQFSVAFAPQTMDNVMAEWLAKHKIPQCHVAETEKYAHVTFFFNGGVEKQFELEHRDLISSPKVATYDLKPEMSAIEVAEKVSDEISSGKFPFVMCNFANPDMVGHTGKYSAAVKAIETTDKAIGIIQDACQEHGYILFVTSDHGNAEQMQDEHGQPHTAHTCNPVPFIITSKEYSFKDSVKGALCDVVPTILDAVDMDIPKEMTGVSLLNK